MIKKNNYILGLHITGPNTSACIIKDGKLVAFAEEERFTRVKLATNSLPVNAIKFCLDYTKTNLKNFNAITVGWSYNFYPNKMLKFYSSRMKHKKKDNYSKIYEQISVLQKSPIFIKKNLEISLRRAGIEGKLPKIFFKRHHLSHAHSVFHLSPFQESVILIIDGSGEEMASSCWIAKNNKIKLFKKFTLPNSIGYFYAALTEYLGFNIFTGEGKVMGLAPYGKHNLKISKAMDKIIYNHGSGYKVDPEYIYFDKRSYSFRHTDKLVKLLGKYPRKTNEEFNNWHKDIAWEAQHKLEQTVINLASYAVKKTGVKNICIGGGIAMNCKMNGLITNLNFVDKCYVIPLSNDAGVSVGSAFEHVNKLYNLKKINKNFNPYLGPSYNNNQILNILKSSKIKNYKKLGNNDLFHYVAKKINKGSIIAWYQGRMEAGARALGNRSILAHPGIIGMKKKINSEVKHRESFRPFAPAILLEYAKDYFMIKKNYTYEPYYNWMLLSSVVNKNIKLKIPSVVHIDNSIRPQIVSKKSNNKFYSLIKAFNKYSGIPVLLNTSLNVRGEPIVNKPEEAVKLFFSTGIDILVMENYIIEK